MKRPDLNVFGAIVADIPATVGPVSRRYVANGQCFAFMPVIPPHAEAVRVYRRRAA